MEDAFFSFISQFGYLAVFGLIFFENVFPPIPSELILPLSGFLVIQTNMELPLVIVSATVGSVVGAFVLYGIGRLLSQDRLESFFDTRPMRLLGFRSDDVSKAIGWFDRRGQITVLLCRCIPVVRSLISIPAGTAKMNVARFSLYTLVGSAVWNTVLCSLGYAAGGAWESVTAQVEGFSDIVKIVLIVIAVIVVVFWVVKRILPAIREGKGQE
ncbi:DedA family protein [Collinsella tanakaei]|uniref:DedA family protein n=1 Tax=Collinsella tanakaei TaxID=626935 RepID=UPI0025A4A9E6|nr:DedA family protein [Collinsella tanakaei]MDM8302794.1 DedA family protein [Collinsella tanakaei]